jgi:serine phosphatase RsbU (regulator of sigma subunit)
MNFRFTIGKKIGTGFGILILLIVVVFGATFFAVNNGIQTFQENDKTSNELINNLTPSKEAVVSLKSLILESKQLAVQWVNDQTRNDVGFKIRLKHIINEDIPTTLSKLKDLSDNWELKENSEDDIDLLNDIEKNTDLLFKQYEQIMTLLPDISSYDDPFNFISARQITDQNGDVVNYLSRIVNNLIRLQNSIELKENNALTFVRKSSEESRSKFQGLRLYWFLAVCLIIIAIIVAIFTTKTIVRPLNDLRNVILSLGKGIFPQKRVRVRDDEVGDMSNAIFDLAGGLSRTTDFAREVGQSNFNSPYTPLSSEDELGHALLKMRDELAETERILEMKVKQRTEEVVQQRDENERQRLKLEDLYKAVTASIRYAKRLQNSILPPKEVISSICPESFVLYKPKDIVSGDFYWFEKQHNLNFFAAVDCTGHGVPGAFMSLVGANGLNAAIRDHDTTGTAEILNNLNTFVTESLNKSREENHIRDGMDIAVCAIDYEKKELYYSGANNPLYIVRQGEVLITKADKFAIGSFDPGSQSYSQHKISLQEGDAIYLFSDGYADQFGGEKGKKYLYKRFRESLIKVAEKSMPEQNAFLKNEIETWQGQYEQVDDILVIGVRI